MGDDDSTVLARLIGRVVRTPRALWERIAVPLRRAYFNLSYPGLQIDAKTRIGRRCEFLCTRGSTIRLEDCRIGPGSRISADHGGRIEMSRVWTGSGCVVAADEGISIGIGTLIADGVTIRDHDHNRDREVFGSGLVSEPIEIGANVWLGTKVTVLKGASIASDVAVGANSVVTRPIVEAGTYAGSPARRLG